MMGDDSRHVPALHELRKLAEINPALNGMFASYDAGAFTIEQALGCAVVMLADQLANTQAAFATYVFHNPPMEMRND